MTRYISYDEANPQEEGIYYCCRCEKETEHKLYDSRDMFFYETASNEELEEAMLELDILKCERCVIFENNQFLDG
jgi:hypothetical protein